AGHVHDQRVERRARLHLEHPGDCDGVERVGPQPVDRLRGKGDDTSGAEEASGLVDGGGIFGRQDASGQSAPAAAGVTTWPPRRKEASMPQAAWMSGPPEYRRTKPSPLSARAEKKRLRSSSEARTNRPVGSLTSITESRTLTPANRRASSSTSSAPVLMPPISTQARATGSRRRAAWLRMAAARAGTS